MKITQTKRFTLTTQLKNPHRLTFLNRKGGVDCVLFTRHSHTEVKSKPQTYLTGREQRTFAVDIDKTHTYFSQHLSEAEFGWLEDLMVSPFVTLDGRLVRVLDGNFKYNTVDRVWQLAVQVQDTYQTHKITL